MKKVEGGNLLILRLILETAMMVVNGNLRPMVIFLHVIGIMAEHGYLLTINTIQTINGIGSEVLQRLRRKRKFYIKLLLNMNVLKLLRKWNPTQMVQYGKQMNHTIVMPLLVGTGQLSTMIT